RPWGPLEDGHRNPGSGGHPPFFSFRTETQAAPPLRLFFAFLCDLGVSAVRTHRAGTDAFTPPKPENPPQSTHASRDLHISCLSSSVLPSANPRTGCRLLSVHSLYVHVCIPINILFANHSLPGDTQYSLFHLYSVVRPLRNWMILLRSLLLGRVAGNCSHCRIALRSAATFIRSSRLASVSR